MEKEIYIHGWFFDWKKVELQNAVCFFKFLKGGMCSDNAVKNNFNKHFKGITYNEMIKAVEEET